MNSYYIHVFNYPICAQTRAFLLIMFFISGCSWNKRDPHKPHHLNHHNSANQHMHKKDHKTLISQFDDPARDEWQKPLEVLKLMGDLSQKKVIDIGSGSGYFARYLVKTNAIITATDIDDVFLEHIKKSLPKKDYPNLDVRKILPNNPLMGEKSFDLAFTCNTFHHLEKRVEYLKKVYQGLKVNGRLVIIDFDKNKKNRDFGPPSEMLFFIDEIKKEVSEAGFSRIQIDHHLLPYQYVLTAHKK